MTDTTHTHVHMSPEQAAQVAGTSRWTIMRAIKSHRLKAVRDNRNHWRISREDLDVWRLHTVRTSDGPHTSSIQEMLEAERLRGEVKAERLLRDAAEADRDHWRAMAERLAERPRGWWPWGKKLR